MYNCCAVEAYKCLIIMHDLYFEAIIIYSVEAAAVFWVTQSKQYIVTFLFTTYRAKSAAVVAVSVILKCVIQSIYRI